jgi:hypothetical protein
MGNSETTMAPLQKLGLNKPLRARFADPDLETGAGLCAQDA